METQFFSTSARTVHAVIFTCIVFAILAYLPNLNKRLALARLPSLHSHLKVEKQRELYLTSAKKLLVEGYHKFRDTAYQFATWDENVIILPNSMLPELGNLPDDVLSISESTLVLMEDKYLRVHADHAISHYIKHDLTPALPRMSAELLEEIDHAMERLLPPCAESTPVNIYKSFAYMIAQASGRLYVGPELCRNPLYLDFSVNFSVEIFNAIVAVKKIRPWLRPLFAPGRPEVKLLRDRERQVTDLIRLEILQREEAAKADPDWKEPEDMMHWIRARSGEGPAKVANLQLTLTWTSIVSSTITATNIVYTLASTPEHQIELREEIRRVLSENGGVLTLKTVQQMHKLDSYMREVSVHYPIGLTVFNRRVLKPITLSNGQFLPKNADVGVMSFPVSDDPGFKFDGLRHYKHRAGSLTADEQASHQLVAVREDHLTFGYGKHSCPGRFLAAFEIKLIIIRFLLKYDISMPNGRTERYPQIMTGIFSSPDTTKEVVLKRVPV